MGCFDAAASERLRRKPIQQVWRDHLLAGSLLLHAGHGYADGFFAFLYPEQNESCARAVAMYEACLTARTGFVPWTLEAFVAALRSEGGGAWVERFARRYPAFERVDALPVP